jgi:hypothetical protein
VPSSVLKKKHLSCGYQCVRECIAAGIIQFMYMDSAENIADILMKGLDLTAFHQLVDLIL